MLILHAGEVKRKLLSCLTLCDFMDYTVHGILQGRVLEWVAFPFSRGRRETFPTQGSNSGLLHCCQVLYQLSHKRSPRILEWVAYPFSSGSSLPRNWTGVSCIAGGFFTDWAIRKALQIANRFIICWGRRWKWRLNINVHEESYWGGKKVLKLIYSGHCTIQ